MPISITIENLLGNQGARSSTALLISNPSHTSAYFRVKLTHPEYYTAVPVEGRIEPAGLQKVRIILTTLTPNCAEHTITILSAVASSNRDAAKFWKSSKSTNCASKTLAVQINLQRNVTHVDDDQASVNPKFSKQQLELYIRNAVHSGQSLSATEKALFPNPTSVPSAVKQFVMKQYQEYSIEVLKCHFRDAARAMVQQGEFYSLQLSVRNDRRSF